MRVIAGSARGRPLRSPEGDTTRPTADRVREAVFNALLSRGPIAGTRVVDLFSGSGALGIEAISRGATDVWFVESDRGAVATIEQNLDTLDFHDRATVVARPVEDAVATLPDEIDIVFADPPYGFEDWIPLLERLGPLAEDDAVVVIESGRSVPVPEGWEKMRERTYGGTVITFTAPPVTPTSRPSPPAEPPDVTGADA